VTAVLSGINRRYQADRVTVLMIDEEKPLLQLQNRGGILNRPSSLNSWVLYNFNQAHDFSYGGPWIPTFVGMTRIEAGITSIEMSTHGFIFLRIQSISTLLHFD
jgi:hypothetical protein